MSVKRRSRFVTRSACLLVPTMLFALLLASCAGSNGPQAAAQRYVDALIKEDYAAAADEVDAGRMGREGVIAILPFLRAELIRQNGTLRSATVEQLERDDDTRAAVVVTWRGEGGELTSSLILARVEQSWKIVDMPAGVPGAQVPIGIEPPVGGEVGVPAAPPPPTPAEQAVTVRLIGLEGLADEARYRITVEAEGLDQPFRPERNDTWTARLPLGKHTLRVSMPGRTDTQASVEVTGTRPPDPVSAELGEQLPIDANTTVLTAGGYSNEWNISSIGPDGLISSDIKVQTVRGLDQSKLAIQFADSKGLGTVGLDGSKTYQWQRPPIKEDFSSGVWIYGPEYKEIAYVENNDVWTLETKPGAKPTRWTELGIFSGMIGYFDADTLLVQGQSERHVLRRDGTGFTYQGNRFERGLTPIYGGAGVSFLEAKGVYFQPGPDELVKRAEVAADYTGVKVYGWTADRKYYLVHSAAKEQNATSGVVALSLDGTARSVAEQLLPTNDYGDGSLTESAASSAFSPGGSRMALVWQGTHAPGVYVLDAAGADAERLVELVPDRIFWPLDRSLIYVIEDGVDMGTWLQPTAGGPARKLFAYRASNVTASGDGTVFLIANNTLWRYDGSGEPQVLGEEGKQAEVRAFHWLSRAP